LAIPSKAPDPQNYHACVSGHLAELDLMNIEVREYLWRNPQELESA